MGERRVIDGVFSISEMNRLRGAILVIEERVIIVEGGSDRKRIRRVLAEPYEIICTNGTVSLYQLEELMEPYDMRDVYVFLDADASGERIRNLFIRNYPEVIHLFTEKVYREVETTPYRVLAKILLAADFKVHPEFLL